jgi:hypothetical protein
LVGQQRLRAAYRQCTLTLQIDPDRPAVLALRARIDAQTGRLSKKAALEIIAGLLERNAGDPYIKVTSAVVRALPPEGEDPTGALREIVAENSDDTYANSLLATSLLRQRSDWTEAAACFSIALAGGGLLSASQLIAAYRLGRRSDPSLAKLVLRTVGPLQGMAIRICGSVARILLIVLISCAAIATVVALWQKDLTWSVILAMVMTGLFGLAISLDAYVGRWKSVVAAFVPVLFLWLGIFALSRSDESTLSAAAYCATPATSGYSTVGTRVEAQGYFKPGVTLKQANHFAEFDLLPKLGQCSEGSTIVASGGVQVLSVLAKPSQESHDSYVISLLESSSLFSAVQRTNQASRL